MPRDLARLNEPVLFVGTTDILNGVSVAIRGDGEAVTRKSRKVELEPQPFDYDDVIASLAIPPLYKDVRRRGTAFWGRAVQHQSADQRSHEPRTQARGDLGDPDQSAAGKPSSGEHARHHRSPNELSGNVSLNKELDMIETINGMLADERLAGSHYTPITVRVIGVEESAPDLDLSYASKFNRDPAFLRHLFALGVTRAPEFYGPRSLRDEFALRLSQSELPVR